MSNDKKAAQLGEPIGTATARLRKAILFDLLQRHHENVCFQCGNLIMSVDELSIEHKEAWLDSDDPVGKFFSLENIAFSHLSCNASSGRRYRGPRVGHGTKAMYRTHGCRCEVCKAAMSERWKRWHRTSRYIGE